MQQSHNQIKFKHGGYHTNQINRLKKRIPVFTNIITGIKPANMTVTVKMHCSMEVKLVHSTI